MTRTQHLRQAESLLALAASNQETLNGKTLLTQDMEGTLHLIDQQIAMAHAHALLAPVALDVDGR